MRKLLFHIKISISFSKIFKFIYFFLRIRQKLEKDELAEFKTGVIKQTVKIVRASSMANLKSYRKQFL